MKIEGDQEIPSALTTLYLQSLNLARPNLTVQKRGPFRYPSFQKNGSKVSSAQLAQRTRFLEARDNFKNISEADRERWYAASPEWNSLLWYYNYFIMSSLAGNANDTQGGIGVVKSIQFVSGEMAVSGDTDVSIDTVDPDKTVAFLFGNSFISDLVQRGTVTVTDGSTGNDSLSPSVDPDICEVNLSSQAGFQDINEGTGSGKWMPFYLSALTSSLITVGINSTGKGGTYTCSYEIIEHKSQTVFPYPKAITATNLKLAWPIQPDEVATIGAIVIEYI